MKKNKIGVVVLNYNDWQTTRRFVNHVDNLRIDSIVIVDNLSKDDSVENLTTLENDKIKLLVAPRNGGYSSGNNIGLRYLIDHEKIDYVIISNPDIIFYQDFINNAEKFLMKDDDLVSVTGVMKYPSGRYDRHPYLRFVNFYKTLLEFIIPISLLLFRPFSKGKYKVNKNVELQYVDALPGCLFMIKADFIKEIGFFDEGTFLYYEEAILGRQIHAKGKKCAIMPNVDYIHDHAKTIGKHYNNVRVMKLYNNSGYYYYSKYCHINKIEKFLYKFFSWLNIEQYKFINWIREKA